MLGVLLVASSLWCVSALDIKECDGDLGMETGEIPDNAVTASSSYVPNVGPQNGRLKLERAGGGWCPKQQVEQGVREYLQVELGDVHLVTGVQTQGRYDHGRGQEYTEEYTVEYWRPGLPDWKQYTRWDGKQILRGNTDTATVVSHRLMPPVFASQVRILPYSVHRRTICLRLELQGCLTHDGVVSYTIPQDPTWGPGHDLADLSYDGDAKQGLLFGGLGRLVDGAYGGDNFKLDIGYGKGNGWVGWRRNFSPKGYIELVFEFDTVRNFSAVNLFTNNYFSKGAQVFAKARIQFSNTGEAYNGRVVSYHYMPDEVLENARNVTIQLHNSVGKFVRIRLFFASDWLLLSEVTFDSDVLSSNYTAELMVEEEQDEEIIMHSVDPTWDTFETIAAPRDNQGYAEIIIGVLMAVMLLLLGVFIIILFLSRRQKLQGSPTTILKNPFSVTINMKDLLMNLTPMNNVGLMPVSGQPTPCSQDPVSDRSFHQNPPDNSNEDKQVTLEDPPSDADSKTLPKESSIKDSSGSERSSYTSSHFRNAQSNGSLLTWRVHPVTSDSPIQSHHYNVLSAEDGASVQLERDKDSASTRENSGSERGSMSSLQIRSLQQSPLTPTRLHTIATDSKRKRYHTETEDSDSDVHGYSTLHMRSLQSNPLHSSSQRIHSDPPTRKRCHTAPREQLRVAPPAVLWNIAPSMGQPYKSREGELTPIPRYCLHVVNKIGSCHLGEAQVCDVEGDVLQGVEGERVCVRSMRGNCVRELRLLCGLNDPNIVRTLGVCTAEQPPWAVFEFPADLGDLVQLLNSQHSLTTSSLMSMASQVASGMKYLESKNLVHKDLAARNCLVGRNLDVKIADIAMCNSKYKDDYSEIGGRPSAPIRWLPWESILLDRYTCASSVWAFGVTVWEILSLARQKPFPHMTNDQVIQNAENLYYGGELQVLLSKPSLCSPDVYELVCACWRRDQSQRPTFKEICLFLKQKTFTTADEIPQYASCRVR
ncbi:discoidin domain-containing receptor tyrosine kinase B [Nilaparvata lugens]|uniref:discoidin domain-containing receptor tyrosine kinase B n=1 Tax=Nilaparvata lugens TaxID=108931 RepID=UPI00193E6584|nr:discoidin domain-containing receptor tyrosine kinase B [Nilaparvata lugens]